VAAHPRSKLRGIQFKINLANGNKIGYLEE